MIMQKIHPVSFVTGFVAGIIVLLIVGMGWRAVQGTSSSTSTRNYTNQPGSNGAAPRNLSRMAERLGMTEADLQKELDSGKTMQDIAKEHGVTMPNRGDRTGNQASQPGGAVSSMSSSSAQ